MRHDLRSNCSYSGSGDATESASLAARPLIKTEHANFSGKDVYNNDDFGIEFRMAPDRTVAEHLLAGMKKENKRFIVLAFVSSTGLNYASMALLDVWVAMRAESAGI